MKSLYILRHAKSDRRHFIGPDHERPLNPRGQRDAPRMGAELSEKMAMPQALWLSTAERVRQTFALLCEGWPALTSLSPNWEDPLYSFDRDEVLAWLAQQDDAVDSALLIGHNPALTDLINLLAGYAAIDNLPTAGFVHFSLNVSHWRDLEYGCGTIESAILPRQLM